MAYHRKVFRCIILAHTRVILAEGYIKAPVQGILNTPVTSGRYRELSDVFQRRNIVMGFFCSGFSLNYTGFHHPDAAQVTPLLMQFQEIRVCTQIILPRLLSNSSSNSGTAVISFVFPSTVICPNTALALFAHALTMCIGFCSLLPLPRMDDRRRKCGWLCMAIHTVIF